MFHVTILGLSGIQQINIFVLERGYHLKIVTVAQPLVLVQVVTRHNQFQLTGLDIDSHFTAETLDVVSGQEPCASLVDQSEIVKRHKICPQA